MSRNDKTLVEAIAYGEEVRRSMAPDQVGTGILATRRARVRELDELAVRAHDDAPARAVRRKRHYAMANADIGIK